MARNGSVGRKLLLVTGFFILLLVSEASSQASSFSLPNEPLSFDPHVEHDFYSRRLIGNVYEALVRRDAESEIRQELATGWSQVDPKIWRFNLRQGVTFHDGSYFTADDVVFSFKRFLSGHPNWSVLAQVVESIKKHDDHTVSFITLAPETNFPRIVSELYIMDEGWARDRGLEKPGTEVQGFDYLGNGTGPFVAKQWKFGEYMRLDPNPSWWAVRGGVRAESVVFRPMGAGIVRVMALLGGEVDMIEPVPLDQAYQISGADNVRLQQVASLRTIFLGMDMGRPQLLYSDVSNKNPFQDKRVRKAFAHAIDREDIRKTVMKGYALPSSSVVPPQLLDKKRQTPSYDPEKGRRLLDEAGYRSGFGIVLDCPNNRYHQDEAICKAVVKSLARIGIRVRLRSQSKSEFFKRMSHPNWDVSFFLLGWSPGRDDALNVLRNLYRTYDGTHLGHFNYTGYSNAYLDDLIDKISTEKNYAQRAQLLNEALDIAHSDIVYIPLHQQVRLVGKKKDAPDYLNFFGPTLAGTRRSCGETCPTDCGSNKCYTRGSQKCCDLASRPAPN